MSKKNWIVASLVLGCGLFSVGAAHATLTTYTSRSAFAAALAASATDSYDDLTAGNQYSSPLTRTGTYGYTATVSGANGFFGAGTASDGWLSTGTNADSITLDAFTGGVTGLGGDFFVTDFYGNLAPDGLFTVAATDADGTKSQQINVSVMTNFLGFISSTGSIGSLLLTNSQPGGTIANARYLTVNDLTLGATATVPEPMTLALVLAALIAGRLVRVRARRDGES